MADEGVGCDLERERAEWRAVAGRPDRFRTGAWICRDHRGNVKRAGQVVDDCIEHLLDALVLERRASQDRDDLGADRAQAQAALDVFR